jgi:hypothetical protein
MGYVEEGVLRAWAEAVMQNVERWEKGEELSVVMT